MKMKWIGISGSWRKINREIEERLRKVVREIIQRGDGIVSGGALGIDYIALDEALKYDKSADRIKIFLPTTLEIYATHYRKHASLGTITGQQAENLISQLTKLKEINPGLKVLLSSGYSIDGRASEIMERGCDGFMQKPFNMIQLSQKIREILEKE